MYRYIPTSVDLEEDTHPLNWCCLEMETDFRLPWYSADMGRDSRSLIPSQLLKIGLQRLNIWRLKL